MQKSTCCCLPVKQRRCTTALTGEVLPSESVINSIYYPVYYKATSNKIHNLTPHIDLNMILFRLKKRNERKIIQKADQPCVHGNSVLFIAAVCYLEITV